MTHKTTRIVVAGRLSERFTDGFVSELGNITQCNDGLDTVIEGHQLDEAHIHGLLMRLRGLGIEIVSLTTSVADQ